MSARRKRAPADIPAQGAQAGVEGAGAEWAPFISGNATMPASNHYETAGAVGETRLPLYLVWEALSQLYKYGSISRETRQELWAKSKPLLLDEDEVEEIKKRALFLGVDDKSHVVRQGGEEKEVIDKAYFYLDCNKEALHVVFLKGYRTDKEYSLQWYIEDLYLW